MKNEKWRMQIDGYDILHLSFSISHFLLSDTLDAELCVI